MFLGFIIISLEVVRANVNKIRANLPHFSLVCEGKLIFKNSPVLGDSLMKILNKFDVAVF